jgi:hypothetical protein
VLYLDLLHEPALVAHRLEAERGQLCADVGGRDPLVARAAAAPVQRVAGEEAHVGGNPPLEERRVERRGGRDRRLVGSDLGCRGAVAGGRQGEQAGQERRASVE